MSVGRDSEVFWESGGEFCEFCVSSKDVVVVVVVAVVWVVEAVVVFEPGADVNGGGGGGVGASLLETDFCLR